MGHTNTLIPTISLWKVYISSSSEVAETQSSSFLRALFTVIYVWGLDIVPCLGVLDFKSNFPSFIMV